LILHFISDDQFQLAQQQPIVTMPSNQEFGVSQTTFGNGFKGRLFMKNIRMTLTPRFQGYTTIRQQDQLAAYQASAQVYWDYDRRKANRGPGRILLLYRVTNSKPNN